MTECLFRDFSGDGSCGSNSWKKSYPMILEDEAGYYAVMLPLKRIPEYRFQVTRGSMKEAFLMLMNIPARLQKKRKEHFVQAFIIKPIRNLVHIRLSVEVCVELILRYGHPMRSV